jgi:hypothetical protein
MAAFATFAAAEIRAKAKVLDKTWINAHAARTKTGTICVRVQRKLSPSDPDCGEWVEITDDGTV